MSKTLENAQRKLGPKSVHDINISTGRERSAWRRVVSAYFEDAQLLGERSASRVEEPEEHAGLSNARQLPRLLCAPLDRQDLIS